MGKKAQQPGQTVRYKKCIRELQQFRKDTGLTSNFYEIEQIKDVKIFNGQRRYLCKWRGFPEEQNTWQPIANLATIPKEIISYEEKNIGKIKRMEQNWMSTYESHQTLLKKDDLRELYRSQGRQMEESMEHQLQPQKTVRIDKNYERKEQRNRPKPPKDKKRSKDSSLNSSRVKNSSKQEQQPQSHQNSISSRTRKRQQPKFADLITPKKTIKHLMLSPDSSPYKEERPENYVPESPENNMIVDDLEAVVQLPFDSSEEDEHFPLVEQKAVPDLNELEQPNNPQAAETTPLKKQSKITADKQFTIGSDSRRQDLKDACRYTYKNRNNRNQKEEGGKEQFNDVRVKEQPPMMRGQSPIIEESNQNSNEGEQQNQEKDKINQVVPVYSDSQEGLYNKQSNAQQPQNPKNQNPQKQLDQNQDQNNQQEFIQISSPKSPHQQQEPQLFSVNSSNPQQHPQQFLSVRSNTPIKQNPQPREPHESEQPYLTPDHKNKSLADTKEQKHSDSPKQKKVRYHKSRLIVKGSKEHIKVRQGKKKKNKEDKQEDDKQKEQDQDEYHFSLSRLLDKIVSEQQFALNKPNLHQIINLHKVDDSVIFGVQVQTDDKIDMRYMSYNMLRDHYSYQLLCYLEQTDRFVF